MYARGSGAKTRASLCVGSGSRRQQRMRLARLTHAHSPKGTLAELKEFFTESWREAEAATRATESEWEVGVDELQPQAFDGRPELQQGGEATITASESDREVMFNSPPSPVVSRFFVLLSLLAFVVQWWPLAGNMMSALSQGQWNVLAAFFLVSPDTAVVQLMQLVFTHASLACFQLFS